MLRCCAHAPERTQVSRDAVRLPQLLPKHGWHRWWVTKGRHCPREKHYPHPDAKSQPQARNHPEKLTRIFHQFYPAATCAQALHLVKSRCWYNLSILQGGKAVSTECITKPISLSSLRRQKVLIEFDGERITSDAGLLLLRQADRRLNLVKRMSACIPDPRDPDCIKHQQANIAQRVMASFRVTPQCNTICGGVADRCLQFPKVINRS